MLPSIFHFVNKISFSFGFLPNGLDNFFYRNLFSHATLKGDFIVLDFDDTQNNTPSIFISYFDSNFESVK